VRLRLPILRQTECLGPGGILPLAQEAKVFWFFSSEKNILPPSQ
jgi:hypothetical protein